MRDPALEVLIILLLLLANGIFAMAEIAIVTARKPRLQQMAESGDVNARAALELANNPNRLLATVQIGITLVGILAGAFGGATVAQEIAVRLNQVPALAAYGESIGVGIVVLSITFFSLIFGELVPKRLALINAERTAARVAIPMRTLSLIAAPVVRLLNFASAFVIRLLGVKPADKEPISAEELMVLIEQGKQSGVFEASEQDMIDRIFELDERRIGAFMIPRTKITPLDIQDSQEKIRRKISDSQHSRFPVIQGDLDNVLGIAQAMTLLKENLGQGMIDLHAILEPPLFVPESMTALKVLELFTERDSKIALVTDEYGSIEGMVTDEIILQDIAGFFPSAEPLPEMQLDPQQGNSRLLNGLLQIDEFKELFNMEDLPDEEKELYQTVGGFVMRLIGSIPNEGQTFRWRDLCIEVIRMDGLRVDKVKVTPIPAGLQEVACEDAGGS